jgi:chondroitin-sulfate-ABC endolyase/exolyase
MKIKIILFLINLFLISTTVKAQSKVEECKPVFNFDLPIATASTSEVNDLKVIRKSLSDQFLGTTAPTAAQLNSAIDQYDALDITVTGNNITGNPVTKIGQINFLNTFAKYLKFNPDDTNISEKAVNAIWFLSNQICNTKGRSVLTFYNYVKLARPAIYLNNYLPDNVKALFGYTLYQETDAFKYLFDANYDFNTTKSNGAINTDVMYLHLDILFAYADWFNTNDEKIRYLKTVKRMLERFLIYTDGQKDGLKKDGLGNHHKASYDGYMYAFSTVSAVIKSLENTSFQIGKKSYLRFRDAIYAQAMYSNDSGVMPFALVGRNPQTKKTSLSSQTLANMAISGGKILELQVADPVLAGVYNRKFGVNKKFNYNSITPFEEGFIQFNYGNLGIYRKNNWIASMKGQSNILWGSEIYVNQNRFGRYQAYGTLEVIYPGENDKGNGHSLIGWDWNYNPGTTTIVLPWAKLHAERGRVDEYNTYGFAGALTLDLANKGVLSNTMGQSGLFAMKFKERNNLGFGATHGPITHNGSFEFTKAYFAIEDYIICLGTDIKNDDPINHTVTTLFQRLNNNSNSIFVNGKKSNQSVASFGENQANWIIDNYNTGYYILPNSGVLKIKTSAQTTPYQDQVVPTDVTIAGNKSNDYHLAYLDHGSAPKNNSYEFVCIPSTNSKKMVEFSRLMQSPQDKPYVVYQNTINQQIIEYKPAKTWAYALPSSNTTIINGLIKANDQPCLVMYKGLNPEFTNIVLTVSNPDLGVSPSAPKVITLTLNNKWTLLQSNPNVNVVSSTATSTVIQFTTADGLPVEIKLTTKTPSKG